MSAATTVGEKVSFSYMREDVPYLSCERWLIQGHYNGDLWLRNKDGQLETCSVKFRLGEVGARQLNRREEATTYRAGDLCIRFDSMEHLVRHAKRVAKAVWGWTGDLGSCYSMHGQQNVTHHERSPGDFVKRSTWTGEQLQ